MAGDEFGEKIGLSKQQVSRIENGHSSPSFEALAAMAREYSIDPRYFFDMLDSAKDADLSQSYSDAHMTPLERVAQLMEAIAERLTGGDVPENLVDRLKGNHELLEIVEIIQFWDGMTLRRLKDVAVGYLAGSDSDSDEQ